MRRRRRGHQQGALDGACGFYAITNALQLLEPELSAEEIFRAAWQGFLRDGNPLALIDGTTRVMLRNSRPPAGSGRLAAFTPPAPSASFLHPQHR
ncbi:MAG TPA: hypothetical protein VJA19_20660 [Pseudomonas sp.]|nr:hypothetical protein [Pseudomonas sp.]